MRKRSSATEQTGMDEPLISAKEIAAKRFSAGFPGYRSEEVDLFLDRIILEFERRDALEKRLRERIRSLSGQRTAGEEEPAASLHGILPEGAGRPGSSFLLREPGSERRDGPDPFRAKRVGNRRPSPALIPDPQPVSPAEEPSDGAGPADERNMEGPLKRRRCHRRMRIRNADLLFPDGGSGRTIGRRKRKPILSEEDRTR